MKERKRERPTDNRLREFAKEHLRFRSRPHDPSNARSVVLLTAPFGPRKPVTRRLRFRS